MAKIQISLLIKKKGNQWCLFTQDGSKELGCHNSKEKAQAQEAAIKSAAKAIPDSFTPFDSRLDLSSIE